MLVGNRLSAWARAWAAVGAAECAAIATSIIVRPSPVIGFLPGAAGSVAVFFAVSAALLACSITPRTRRRFGMVTFAIAGTAHAMYGVGALGYSVTLGMSWVLASAMFELAALNFLAAWKIAGVRH